MTVIDDMVSGHLIGVETGRTADVFSGLLKRLPQKTTENIEAVAMDMGPSYQKSVRDCLPNADIVFDRFHVMQNYSKAMSNQRRIEYRKANKTGKELLKVLKEPLQALWLSESYDDMQANLEQWCVMAEQTSMIYLKKFAKSLRQHREGIGHFAKHKLTSARIEAGNISIGMIRKRARGIRDTEDFKLKIRQSSMPDNQSIFYATH